MGSSPFFLENYLTPEDLVEGLDYTDPLGIRKYKPVPEVEPPPMSIIDRIKGEEGLGNKLEMLLSAGLDPVQVATQDPNWTDKYLEAVAGAGPGESERGFIPGAERASRTLAKKAVGIASSPLTGYFSVPGVATSIPGRIATGGFGIGAASSGGHDIGEALAGLDAGNDISSPVVVEKLTSGLADLSLAGPLMRASIKAPPVSESNPNIVWKKTAENAPEISLKNELADIGEFINPFKGGEAAQTGVLDPSGKTIAARNYADSLRAKYGSGWMAKSSPLEKRVLSKLQVGEGTVVKAGDVPRESTVEPNLKVETNEPVPKGISEYKAPYENLESELSAFEDWKKSPELENIKESIINPEKAQPVEEAIRTEPLPEDQPINVEPLPDIPKPRNFKPIRVEPIETTETGIPAPVTKPANLDIPSPKRLARREPKSLVEPNEKNLLDDLTDLPKTLRASMDISYPLRQGLFLANRPTAVKAMARGTKSIVSHENHLAIAEDLANRPNAGLYEKFGLNQIKYDPTEVAQRNEQFPSEMAQKIPGIKQSERAYTDASNLSRADMFDELTEKFSAAGKTPENRPDLYHGMAKYLNVLTGRDPLPKKLQDAGWILNKAFWSPMYVKSRMQLLNPVFYAKLPREMQVEAIRDVGGTLAVLGTALAGIKAIGGDQVEIETDPRHTNFGKVKVGHTTYDFFTGLLPLIRTASRISTGEIKTPKGDYAMKGGGIFANKEAELPQMPFGGRTALGELESFGEGKLSPVISATKSELSGVGYGGEEYDWPEFARDVFAPMAPTDLISAWKNWDAEEGMKALPSILGVNVQTDLPESQKVHKKVAAKKSNKKKVVKINW